MVTDVVAQLAAKVGGVTHGTVPVANNSLGDKSGEVVVIFPADSLNSQGNVGSREGVVAETNFGTDKVGGALLLSGDSGGGRGGRLAREGAKLLFSQFYELVVGNATSTDEDHAVSRVVCLDIINQVLALDSLDILLGAQDGSSQWLVLESGRMQMVKYNFFKLFINLLLLPKNDIPFPLNSGRL